MEGRFIYLRVAISLSLNQVQAASPSGFCGTRRHPVRAALAPEPNEVVVAPER